MRNLKNCFLLLLVVGVFASSCKKDEGASTTELLTTSGGWILDSFSDNSEDIIENIVDLTMQTFPEELRTPENEAIVRQSIAFQVELEAESSSEPCDEDDVIVFNTDGTVTQLSGAIKCDSTEPDEADGGTWVLSENDSKLTFDSFTYDIGSISSSKLELEVREVFSELIEAEEADFSNIENVDGYQDLLNSELIYTIHLRAN